MGEQPELKEDEGSGCGRRAALNRIKGRVVDRE
jgi:hypothetical protein